MHLEVKIRDEFKIFIDEIANDPAISLEKFVADTVNERFRIMRLTRDDMNKFRKYKKDNRYSGRFLAIYRYRLRKSLGWTNSHLMDIEDEVWAADALRR
jgi:hypothetical protein